MEKGETWKKRLQKSSPLIGPKKPEVQSAGKAMPA
jgi:hypothetical protein